MDDFEKRWKRIQDQLRIQMNGDEQPRVSSGRTLFGIPSEAERKMERFAREIEEEYRAKRLAQNRSEAQSHAEDPDSHEDPKQPDRRWSDNEHDSSGDTGLPTD